MLIDPEKVHTIDYDGQYYKSRGPLNSGPAPQGRPVIAQAGGSAKGRTIAAQYADTIVAHPKGVDGDEGLSPGRARPDGRVRP